MKNNIENTTDATKPRNEIKLTGIEIDEPENDETNVTVEIQVPFEFYLSGRRDLDEYERIAIEDLRIKASAVFEHINLLSFLNENGNIDNHALWTILSPLSVFGKGLMEAQEIIQMSFERYREGIPQAHERQAAESEIKIPPPSFSESTIKAAKNHIWQVTANKIHHALTSDKVSTEIKVAIEDILTTAANETMDVNIYHPALVKTAFLLMMDELEQNYAKGVLHSIQSILDTLPVEVREEFTQFERHISENREPLKFTDEDDDEKTVQIGDLGIALYKVLHNPQLPSNLYEKLMSGLNDLFNALPAKNQQKLELTEDYLADLLTYHAEKEEKETEQKQVLDLSEVCTEFLGTNEATAGEKRIPLANLLSAVMKHPDLPKSVYDSLDEIFCHTPEDFSERPEVIQSSLEALRLEENRRQ